MAKRKKTSDVGMALARHLNAVTHGLSARTPVIPGVESQEEWEACRQAWIDDRKPVGKLEEHLVDRIALNDWKLQRIVRAEREYITSLRDRIPHDLALKGAWRDQPASVEEAEQRTKEAKRCLAVIKNLTKTPRDTPLVTSDVERILTELADEADKTPEAYIEGIDAAFAGPEWTAGRLLTVLRSIAKRDGAPFAGAMLTASYRMLGRAKGVEKTVARARDDMERMLRERLLPEKADLDRVMRYEAQSHRHINQLLTLLEAAQAQRAGTPTPLTRIAHIVGA